MSRMFHAPGAGCLQDSIALQTVSVFLGDRPASRVGRQMVHNLARAESRSVRRLHR